MIAHDLPGAVLRCVGGLAGVVGGKSFGEVGGEAYVVLFGVGDALEEVDVFHLLASFHGGL